MSIALIAAVAENNCIGKDGKLPWHIPEDLAHFKSLTAGKIVLMGRKTWESLPEKFRPLPNRLNLVITRQTDFLVPAGVEKYSDITTALAAHKNEDVMIIGGAEIYRATIDLADTLYITHVPKNVDGDAFFPAINKSIWKKTNIEPHGTFDFVTYQK